MCRKRDDEASRARGGAVPAEGWAECRGDKGSEPDEGQQSVGQPAGELGLLNLGGEGPAGAGGGVSGCGSADGDVGSR